MSEVPREELSPDENRLLNKMQGLYERAVDTAAASKRIVSVDDPRIVLARDGDGRPTKFGGKVPSWEEVKPDKDELAAIERLEEPVGVISIPALSLRTQAEIARTLKTPLNIWSSWDLEADETGDLVGWRPENPKKGLAKAQRKASGVYTGDDIDVVFQDGAPEVPDSTLGLDAFDMRELCREQGVIQPDVDAYLALQLEGVRRNQPFDSRTFSWLDGYLKSFRAVVLGDWDPLPREMALSERGPERAIPYLGGRRAVRVKLQ